MLLAFKLSGAISQLNQSLIHENLIRQVANNLRTECSARTHTHTPTITHECLLSNATTFLILSLCPPFIRNLLRETFLRAFSLSSLYIYYIHTYADKVQKLLIMIQLRESVEKAFAALRPRTRRTHAPFIPIPSFLIKFRQWSSFLYTLYHIWEHEHWGEGAVFSVVLVIQPSISSLTRQILVPFYSHSFPLSTRENGKKRNRQCESSTLFVSAKLSSPSFFLSLELSQP